MTDLSIIIVSYNVRFFTAQCIASIYQSDDHLTKEIIVVDNASDDGSVDFIRTHFPDVILIENEKNAGFGKANNQGFKLASGKHILILNPDTIVERDTLKVCFDFLEEHKEYGAVGVKMIDGKGNFLPESRRSLPTLSGSFYKFSGVNKLFPASEVFNAYYMGDKPFDQSHDTEVLTGAFIYTRKELITRLEGFDEAYFMYGEDIDLCKRILDAGYKIRYIANTGITHFKGESTHKDTFAYIRSFYGAMKTYFNKNHHLQNRSWLNTGITASIYLLALINWIKLTLKSNVQFVFGCAMSFLSFFFVKEIWARWYFQNPGYFDSGIYYNLAVYSLIFTSGTWLTGWFDKGKKFKHLLVGGLVALGIMLMIYAVIPEHIRYSRAIIFIGVFISFFIFWLVNQILEIVNNKEKSIIIVSEKESGKSITELLSGKMAKLNFFGFVHPSPKNDDASYLENIDHLQAVIQNYKPDIVVLNVKEIGVNDIGKYILTPTNQVRYLITSMDNSSLIETSESKGKSYIWDAEPVFNLSKPMYRRMKRITELKLAFIALLFSPFILFLNKNIVLQIFSIFMNNKILVSYIRKSKEIPSLKGGFFNTKSLIGEVIKGEMVNSDYKADICYAKHYTPFLDILIVYRSLLT